MGMGPPEYVSYFPELRKNLTSPKSFEGKFVIVDCSTKSLMRCIRFGLYLVRVAYASVNPKEEENPVKWEPILIEERMSTVVGDYVSRRKKLERIMWD